MTSQRDSSSRTPNYVLANAGSMLMNTFGVQNEFGVSAIIPGQIIHNPYEGEKVTITAIRHDFASGGKYHHTSDKHNTRWRETGVTEAGDAYSFSVSTPTDEVLQSEAAKGAISNFMRFLGDINRKRKIEGDKTLEFHRDIVDL